MTKRSYRISRLLSVATCFMIFLTLYVATSPIYVQGALTATVSGRVVDEYGGEMKYVEIKVYTSDGAYVKSRSTRSDGSFSIELEIAKSYILHFSKEGYAKVTKTASLIGGETVNLGDMVLLKSLRLSSSILSLVASLGDKLTLPFVVSNIGEESEKVEFLISKPEGWSTQILDQAGHEITKAELSPDASLNFQLEVTIPLTSAGDNNLTLTTVGKTNSTLDFMIDVQPMSKSIIFCQFPGKSATPGDTVQFQVRLKNPFGVEMRFKISLDSIPPNWTASVKNTSGEYVTEVTLDSDEFVDVMVEVKSPDAAKIGEEYGLLVKVESYDGNIVDSLPLNIALNEVEKEIKITTKFSEVTVEAGKVVQYPITIVNSGDVDRLLLLSVEPPAYWKAVFKSGVLEVSRLYMEAGGTENLDIEVTPPSTVNIGTYIIPVQVKSEKGAIYTEIDLKATIVGSYVLSLEPSTLLTSVTTGGSTMFTVKVTNTGYTSVTGVGLDVEASEEWELSITPIQVESLEPRESSTFTVVVKTPEDAVAGDYMITLTGLSDQVESDQVQVRVTVTTSTLWGWIGVGTATVMIIVLIFVFIKFKRR